MKVQLFEKKRRIFSVVLALAMVFSLLPMNSITASAAGTTFSFPLWSGTKLSWLNNYNQCINAKADAMARAAGGDFIEIYGEGCEVAVYVTLTGGNSSWNCSENYVNHQVKYEIPEGYAVKDIIYDSTLKNGESYPAFSVELYHLCPSVTKKNGQEPTCSEDGWKDYYQCTETSCQKIYASEDKTGTAYATLEEWKQSEEGKLVKGHDWVYAANNGTLTVSCSRKSTCGKDAITLTLAANDAVYTGNAYTGASIDNTSAWKAAGFTEPTISYVGRGDTVYGENKVAPTKTGTYTAKISPVGTTATDANTAKVNFEITKSDAAAPTGLTGVKPSQNGGKDGKITGVDTTMEYSTDDGKTWKDVTGTSITGLSAGDVLVRIKETENTAASEATKITVAEGDKVKPTAKPTATPTVKPTAKPATISPAKLQKNSLTLSTKLKSKQKDKKITVSWAQVKDADGYNVYAAYCGEDKFEKVGTTKSNKATRITIKKLHKKVLNLKKNFKYYIEAYKLSNNKEVIVAKSISSHNAGIKNHRFTNVKSISVSKTKMAVAKGKNATIVAKTKLADPKKKQLGNVHAKEFRYATSDKAIVTVDKNGVIKGIDKGTAYVYVYSRNGISKKITVTVK